MQFSEHDLLYCIINLLVSLYQNQIDSPCANVLIIDKAPQFQEITLRTNGNEQGPVNVKFSNFTFATNSFSLEWSKLTCSKV